ncbi:MAG: TIGR00266 family protein [Clostridiales Family XIII bacterium]|jgi:uncharacterized protein (TIGR00266 family)|nr:TIGR00266 family protein [Clostridiales Family XIII bacterium]
MDIRIETELQFPMATFVMQPGEMAQIQRGSMIYRTAGVDLNTRLNAKGSGVGKVLSSMARSAVSNESMFITEVVCNVPDGHLAIAPSIPGAILQLDVGVNQYRINDSCFLAMEGTVAYTMQRQSLGRAMFGGQGGFFVMTTEGQGRMLVNAFGSVKTIQLNNSAGFTIDNAHVVAWDRNLEYDISLQSGFFGSIGTGEGVVNVFRGTGKILIQTLNLQTFADQLMRFIPSSK